MCFVQNFAGQILFYIPVSTVTTLCFIHAAGTAAWFTGQSSRNHAQRVRLRTRGQGSVEGTWRVVRGYMRSPRRSVLRFQLQCSAVPSRRYTSQQHQNIVFLLLKHPMYGAEGFRILVTRAFTLCVTCLFGYTGPHSSVYLKFQLFGFTWRLLRSTAVKTCRFQLHRQHTLLTNNVREENLASGIAWSVWSSTLVSSSSVTYKRCTSGSP